MSIINFSFKTGERLTGKGSEIFKICDDIEKVLKGICIFVFLETVFYEFQKFPDTLFHSCYLSRLYFA